MVVPFMHFDPSVHGVGDLQLPVVQSLGEQCPGLGLVEQQPEGHSELRVQPVHKYSL